MWARSLGWEDPLQEEMAAHSSIPAWRILWTEEPGELQPTGLQRVRHNCACSQGQVLFKHVNLLLLKVRQIRNLLYVSYGARVAYAYTAFHLNSLLRGYWLLTRPLAGKPPSASIDEAASEMELIQMAPFLQSFPQCPQSTALTCLFFFFFF